MLSSHGLIPASRSNDAVAYSQEAPASCNITSAHSTEEAHIMHSVNRKWCKNQAMVEEQTPKEARKKIRPETKLMDLRTKYNITKYQ